MDHHPSILEDLDDPVDLFDELRVEFRSTILELLASVLLDELDRSLRKKPLGRFGQLARQTHIRDPHNHFLQLAPLMIHQDILACHARFLLGKNSNGRCRQRRKRRSRRGRLLQKRATPSFSVLHALCLPPKNTLTTAKDRTANGTFASITALLRFSAG